MLYSLFLEGLLSYTGYCSKEFNFGKLPTSSLCGICDSFSMPVMADDLTIEIEALRKQLQEACEREWRVREETESKVWEEERERAVLLGYHQFHG